jgi:hypothetical protein
MQILFENKNCSSPKVSIILLDWSCRESFHILNFLKHQNISRDMFEVIVIEYYQNISKEISAMLDNSIKNDEYPILDQWIVMDMPKSCYYHKHLMYNIGIASAKGDIITVMDSDVMVKPSFVLNIINEFKKEENIVLHIDEFRNINKKFYPFNYPTFDDILGEGCINNIDGKTKGVIDRKHDCLHVPNYGACFSALKKNLIAIGGADEHMDYLGHICGPYEMTFRLVNLGLTEIWSDTTFIYHTWHPGTDGIDNFLGPHDGRNMSSTALEVISSKRILPLTINRVIKDLMERSRKSGDAAILDEIINPDYLKMFKDANYFNSDLNIASVYPENKIFKNKDFYIAVPAINRLNNDVMSKQFFQLIIDYYWLVDKSFVTLMEKMKNKHGSNYYFSRFKNEFIFHCYYCENFLNNVILPKYKDEQTCIIFTDKIQFEIFKSLIKKKHEYSKIKVMFSVEKEIITTILDKINSKYKILIDINFFYLKNELKLLNLEENVFFEKINKTISLSSGEYYEYAFYFKFNIFTKFLFTKFLFTKSNLLKKRIKKLALSLIDKTQSKQKVA